MRGTQLRLARSQPAASFKSTHTVALRRCSWEQRPRAAGSCVSALRWQPRKPCPLL